MCQWTSSPCLPSTFLVSSNLKQDIGYPNNDSYDAYLPDERTSMVFGLGRVSGSAQALDDGHSSRVVNVALSHYVRDETRGSTVQCVFDMSTARWTRVPVPHANSNMQFNGVCRDITAAGILRIKVLSTASNVPPNSSAPSDSIAQPSRESSSAPPTHQSHPLSVAATSHSPTPFPFNMAPSAPMLYWHPFQQCPQHVSSASAPFMAPFPHSLPYSLPAQHIFPHPGSTTHSHYNSWGEYINPVDPLLQTTPETGSSLAPSDRLSDDDSAFNKSAANPYSYPMTQTPQYTSASQPSAPAKSANDNSPMSIANEGFFGSQPASQQSTSRAQPLSL
ncbi:hypothetical protein K438DRAFT_1973545 [Mycena galopus ATCC 62051]|nr:hypothetical protein K438DRAFT_1973545 [Mycena galopus ATCC 62051]